MEDPATHALQFLSSIQVYPATGAVDARVTDGVVVVEELTVFEVVVAATVVSTGTKRMPLTATINPSDGAPGLTCIPIAVSPFTKEKRPNSYHKFWDAGICWFTSLTV